MYDSFNFSLFVEEISFIFVDYKFIAYKMEVFTRGRIIGMMEYFSCHSGAAETVSIEQSPVVEDHMRKTTP